MVQHVASLPGPAFVQNLKSENECFLAKLDTQPALTAETMNSTGLLALLKAALKNEMEAAEIAVEWTPSTPEVEVKVALAYHAGDEARHYQLLKDSIEAAGVELGDYNPLDPPSPVLEYLRKLTTSPERIAAALVAREAMGGRRNRQFLMFLEHAGYTELAQLYRDVINPDEERHHQAGCALLAKLAVTGEAQKAARQAATGLLEIGDRMRENFMQKTGCGLMPGC